MPKLYLVDASGYIFRAYYAVRPLSNSKGLPTNALFGFTSMLLKLLREQKPEMIGIVFDVARKTFRNEKYADYKANRSEPPPDLVPQFPYFRKIVQAFNLPVLEMPNYEADDVIGTLARRFEKEGGEVVIVTGDKDLMQLVNEKVTIYDSMKDRWIHIPEVQEKFGVNPEQVTDVLALAGDASDNIPGVSGIGDKTATKLIQEYGSLENLLKNASSVKGKLGEKLKESVEQARLFKDLATVVTDVPLAADWKTFSPSEPQPDRLRDLFEELEFRKLLTELVATPTLSKEKYSLVCTPDELKNLVDILRASKGFAVDTETTSLDTLQAKLVGLSFSAKEGEAFYVPIGHSCEDTSRQLSKEDVLQTLKPLLEDPNLSKYAQHAKYDYAILKNHGITLAGLQFDTLIGSYLLNPDTSHSLDQLAQEYLSHKTTTYEEVVGKGKKQKNFSEVDLEVARDYSCEDADVTYRLVPLLEKRLREENLDSIFCDIEMPLLFVLAKMERNGVRIDTNRLQKTSEQYGVTMKELEEKVYRLAGMSFNLNSTKQLAEVLFEKMKLPVIRKTKTGYSTDVDVLRELAETYEVAQFLLEYRSLSKLKSTYLDALPALVHPKTGRLHTSFHQTVAATGRLSSSDPNLQNIPIRTEEGRKIREAFIAQDGFDLLSADYSQIELRILAHLSQEPALLEAFHQDRDIHQATAVNIFGVAQESVTNEMRGIGKTVNFAVLYGQGAYSLSQQLEIEMGEAENYIRNYFGRYPQVAAYRQKILAEVRKNKYVKTLFGRLRRFPEIDNPNANIRAMAERTAFNTVFQGTAADLIKKAMIRIQQRIEKEFPQAMMLIQVHDELVFEVPHALVSSFSQMVKEEMESVTSLAVPLRVDVGIGPNWAMAH